MNQAGEKDGVGTVAGTAGADVAAAQVQSAAAPKGVVENLGPGDAWGWVAWRGKLPPAVSVRCGDAEYAVNVHWVARPDLALDAGPTPGFQFRLPFEVTGRLVTDPALVPGLQVLLDGAPLPFAKGVTPAATDADDWEAFPFETSLRLAGRQHPVQAWVDAPFRIKCRIEHCEVDKSRVALLCNGTAMDATVIATAEEQVPVAGGKPEVVATVYEVELPGFLWEHLGPDDLCPVQLSVDGIVMPAVPVPLALVQARRWIEQQVVQGPHESYDQLLAIEHAAVVGSRFEFDASVATYFEWVARNHGLKEMLGVIGQAEQEKSAARQEVDLGSMLVGQTLRDFNLRLPDWAGREEQLLASIEETLPAGEQRTQLYMSVLPYFCAHGRFEAMRQRMPATHVDALSWSRNVYEMSSALPFLVADGRLDRATELLYACAGQHGWLASEPIAVASRLAAEQTRVTASNEKFAYALIAVLDKLAPDYWSRLHDVQLIEALAAWLQEPVYWTQWLWRDLVAASLRLYGLSPGFWERVAPLLANEDSLYLDLREAHARFESLRASVQASAADVPLPAGIRDDLAFFLRAKNHEAGALLRELVASRLIGVAETDVEAARLPLQDLLALGAEESVRLAAMPVASDAALLARLPALRARLTQMYTRIPQSPRYALQCRIGATLAGLAAMTDADAAALTPGLLRDAEGFGDGASESLAVDVLAGAWRRVNRQPAATALASAFARHALQSLQAPGEWPAQPLLAGIARFRAGLAETGDRIAGTYLNQIELQLAQRFRERREAVEAAMAAPAGQQMRVVGNNDTLVVIYSCRKYLDTRIKAIRESWLPDLKARGIPYVILVGDGDDALHDDVLALAVSDRYEDLPAKSLAMIRWVAQHTDFQYLLKIDDDCLLNVDAYFGSLSYRKFHYYGRILTRNKGAMDRVWHQSKSQGERARSAIDKSPEPSIYADGGGAYSLSRLAMMQVLEQARTSTGQRLIASSFMEDKLVGDLLARAAIKVANEDYYTLVRRRFGDNATPVCVWDNCFVPSASSPTKLAHLDTADHMVPVRAMMSEPHLWPKKIWPTYALPGINLNSNQLELLTPLAQARALLAEQLLVVAVMRNEKIMLPHFLAHYRKLGVRAFIIVDNLSDDGTRETLLAQPDVVLYSADTEYKLSTYGVAWQQAVLANHCVGKWALVADADELLVYPGCETRPLADFVRDLDAAGHDAACVHMVDMYPFGDLEEADLEKADPFSVAPWFDSDPVVEWRLTSGAYSNATNNVSALRHRLLPSAEPHAFTTQKFCLVRYAPWMRFCAGLHNVANARVSPLPAWFAHFKYHAGFKAKVEEEVARKQHFGDAQEYRKYFGLLAEGRGKFGVDGLSRRYTDSSSFLAAHNKEG